MKRFKKYYCSYCEKTFNVHSQMIVHIRQHTGEKPFDCVYCLKGFASLKVLKVHERIHTGEKPYKCSYCDKRFSAYANLVVHKRIHTHEKPYKCKLCKRGFEHSGNLNRHFRAHMTDYGFRCILCSKHFEVDSEILQHTKADHPTEYLAYISTPDGNITSIMDKMKCDSPERKNLIIDTDDSNLSSNNNNTINNKNINNNCSENKNNDSNNNINNNDKKPDDSSNKFSNIHKISNNYKFCVRSKSCSCSGCSNCNSIKSCSSSNNERSNSMSSLISPFNSLKKSNKEESPELIREWIKTENQQDTNTSYNSELSESKIPDLSASNIRKESAFKLYYGNYTNGDYAESIRVDDNSTIKYSLKSLKYNYYKKYSDRYQTSLDYINRTIAFNDSDILSSCSHSLTDPPPLIPIDNIEPSDIKFESKIEYSQMQESSIQTDPSEDFQYQSRLPRTHTSASYQSYHPDNEKDFNCPLISSSDCEYRTKNQSHYIKLNDRLLESKETFGHYFASEYKSFAFRRNVEKVLLRLIGKRKLNEYGYPEKTCEQVLIRILDDINQTSCSDVRVDEEERFRINVRLLIEQSFPNESTWNLFEWKGKSIDYILEQIISKNLK